MRFYSASFLLLGSSVSVNAFAPQAHTQPRTVPIYATKPSQNDNNIVVDTLEAVDATVKGAMSGMALAAAFWVAPATMAGPITSNFPGVADNVMATSVASAKEMASGTGTRVNKDPESLLRYGLPIDNKEVCM